MLGRIRIEGLTGFADQWFERGQIEVLSGASAGMSVMVKADRLTATGRVVDLWHGTGAVLAAGAPGLGALCACACNGAKKTSTLAIKAVFMPRMANF